MSTLRTHNVQSSDSSDVNIKLTSEGGVIVAGVSTFSSGLNFSSSSIFSGISTFSNDVNIGTGGTTARFDVSSGKVGIGSAIPDQKFVVMDDVASGTSNVYIRNSGGNASLYLLNDDQTSAAAGTLIDNGSVIDFSGKWSSTNPNAHRTFGRIAAYKENEISTNGSGYLSLSSRPNGSGLREQLRITGIGSVGISTDIIEDPIDIRVQRTDGYDGGGTSAQDTGRVRINQYSHVYLKQESSGDTNVGVSSYWGFAPRGDHSLSIGYGPLSAANHVMANNDSTRAIVIQGNRTIDLPNQERFLAYKTANQSETDNTNATITFGGANGTISFDTSSGWDDANNRYVVQNDGYFLLIAHALIRSNADNSLRDACISIERSTDSGSNWTVIATNGERANTGGEADTDATTLNVHIVFGLNSGDWLRVGAYGNTQPTTDWIIEDSINDAMGGSISNTGSSADYNDKATFFSVVKLG